MSKSGRLRDLVRVFSPVLNAAASNSAVCSQGLIPSFSRDGSLGPILGRAWLVASKICVFACKTALHCLSPLKLRLCRKEVETSCSQHLALQLLEPTGTVPQLNPAPASTAHQWKGHVTVVGDSVGFSTFSWLSGKAPFLGKTHHHSLKTLS